MRDLFLLLVMSTVVGCAKASVPAADPGTKLFVLEGHFIQVPGRWLDSTMQGDMPNSHRFYDSDEASTTGHFQVGLYRSIEPLAFLALETDQYRQVKTAMDASANKSRADPLLMIYADAAEGIAVLFSDDSEFGRSYVGFRTVFLPEFGRTLSVSGNWSGYDDALSDLRSVKALPAPSAGTR